MPTSPASTKSQAEITVENADIAPAPASSLFDLSRYVWLALAVVLVLQGGAFAFKSYLVPSEVRPLNCSLSELPLTIGQWTGKEMQIDAKLFAAVGADEQNERLYTNAAGDAVFVHRAAWLGYDDWVPHLPEVCYANSGWTLTQTRAVTLPERPEAHLVLQNFEQSGKRIVVAYWYQLDEQTHTDREGGRKFRRAQLGRRFLPPLLKTLLQTDETDHAEKRLFEIATRAYDFNREL